MRVLCTWAVALAVGAAGAVPVWSQEPVLPERTTVKLLLLRQKSVQKELGVSDDLAKKVMAFTDEESEAAGKALAGPEADRKKAFEQLEEKNKQFLAANLSDKQNKRLDQIALQFTAAYQLTTPEAAKTLSLTEDQQKKFKALHDEYRKEVTEILFGKESAGRAERYAKLREKTKTQILAILTEKQQAQVREVVGAPFTGEIVFEEHELPKKK
jgi:hypothetical protein